MRGWACVGGCGPIFLGVEFSVGIERGGRTVSMPFWKSRYSIASPLSPSNARPNKAFKVVLFVSGCSLRANARMPGGNDGVGASCRSRIETGAGFGIDGAGG